MNHSRAASAVAQALLTVISSQAHEGLKLPKVVEALFVGRLLLAMQVDQLHDSSTEFHGVLEYLLLSLHGVICIFRVLVDLIDVRHSKNSHGGRLRFKSAQDGHALLCLGVVAGISAQG